MKTETTWKQLPTWIQDKLTASPLGSPVKLTGTIRICATEPGRFDLWDTTGIPVLATDLQPTDAA